MLAQPSASQELWGHQAAEQTLLNLALSGRMPHGWIFSGPAGIGKATLAFRLARFLLHRGFEVGIAPGLAPRDLSVPANSTVSAQVAAGSHPDLLVVTPEDDVKDLNVEQIRTVAPFLSMTAAQSGWRMVIIDGADRMNRAAQNALLKVLEEPSPNSILILLTDHLGKMLPTIRSRSRLLRLSADHEQSLEILAGMDDRLLALPPNAKNILWNMAGEAPGQLLALLEQDAITALEHLRGYIRSPNLVRMNELTQGFAYEPQFSNAARVLMWLCHHLATGQEMDLPPVRVPALLKFHEEAQTMLAETSFLHLDGAACWHELLSRLSTLFETP